MMDTRTIWDSYRNLTYADLPTAVRSVAEHCILDWYGCAAAGAREPLASILRATFGKRSGECSVIGSNGKVDVASAALLNGASGHALDYDDTGSRTLCHSTAPVLPAAIAVAESIGASGAELITAFVVGVEILGRVAAAMGSDHYARGWHTTATYGTFGAAAAAAHLMRLDHEQFPVAMGLAASHASGVKANFGTMTKPYHAGHAAEGGVNSALLAAAGFTANPDAISGNQGFIPAASNNKSESEITAEEWVILGTLFKYHAACHLTHATIEAVTTLRSSLAVAELSALTVTVHPSLLDVCGIELPTTGLEGKFSLRGTASLALNDINTADPGTFSDTVINSESVQQMLARVTIETDASLATMQSRVTWVDHNQQRHEQFHDVGVPAKDLEAQGEKLSLKHDSLCAFAETESLRHTLADLPQQRVVTLP